MLNTQKNIQEECSCQGRHAEEHMFYPLALEKQDFIIITTTIQQKRGKTMGSAVVTLCFNSLYIIFTEEKQLLALLTAYLILRELSLKLLEIEVHTFQRADTGMAVTQLRAQCSLVLGLHQMTPKQ